MNKLERFTVNGNGTVTSAPSQALTWSPMLGNGQMTFAEARQACADLNEQKFGGRTDWYIPEIGDLLSTVDYTRYDPAADPAVFPDARSGYYWTNTPTPWDPSCVFVVHFSSGGVYYDLRNDKAFLRAVSRAPAGQ